MVLLLRSFGIFPREIDAHAQSRAIIVRDIKKSRSTLDTFDRTLGDLAERGRSLVGGRDLVVERHPTPRGTTPVAR